MRIGIAYREERIAKALSRLIFNHSEHEVAWVVNSVTQVINRISEEKPDLILLDLNIPPLGGVEATHRIMQHVPCAILLLVQSENWSSAEIFEAMGKGALDVQAIQTVDFPWEIQKDPLLKKIETISLLLGPHIQKKKNEKKTELPDLVIVGASTGGPLALTKLLSRFPTNNSLAIVVIQHVDESFATGFASWLAKQISLKVKIVNQRTFPEAGLVLVAGMNQHLVMDKTLELVYAADPIDSFYKPSIDVFFKSVAENWPNLGVAILLTGMGSDGARGLKHLYDLGWYTIAQREKSCVVYGMPKAAIDMGVVREILDVERIADAVKMYFQMSSLAKVRRRG